MSGAALAPAPEPSRPGACAKRAKTWFFAAFASLAAGCVHIRGQRGRSRVPGAGDGILGKPIDRRCKSAAAVSPFPAFCGVPEGADQAPLWSPDAAKGNEGAQTAVRVRSELERSLPPPLRPLIGPPAGVPSRDPLPPVPGPCAPVGAAPRPAPLLGGLRRLTDGSSAFRSAIRPRGIPGSGTARVGRALPVNPTHDFDRA